MLSVIVIAKNEEKLIGNCLESVRWADEIIVADNGSTDKTVEVAKRYTDEVFTKEGQDFAALRNSATKRAKGEWVLFVDADERVLKPLKEEIEELVGQDEFAAYALPRRNIIFGEEVRYKAFWPDWVVRLLRKKDFEEYVGKVHEYPKFKGELGYTKNFLLHLTHRDVDQIVAKSLDWSKIDAHLRLKNHPPMTGWRFLRILISELWNQGIKRRGFFAGTVGVMDSLLQTFSLIITYIRLWQLQQARGREEVYQEIDEKLKENGFTL